MAVKIGISLKVTILVIIISTSLIFGLGAVNYANQMEVFDDSMSDQVNYYANIFNVFFNNYKFEKENTTKDLNYTVRGVKHIESISINFINRTKYDIDNTIELYEFASYEFYVDYWPVDSKLTFDDIGSYDKVNMNVIDNILSNLNQSKVGGGDRVLTSSHMQKIKLSDGASWFIVMPLVYNNSKETYIIGTCALLMSWLDETENYERELMNLIYGSFITTIGLVVALIYIIRLILVKPIKTFGDTAKDIGKGKLDIDLDIESSDELKDLADAFNQMAKDLRESRDKIEDYNKILENLLNQKDEFIGQLGHDLKNPLQPLVGLLPLLIEQEKDPKIKETLQVMNQNVEYMRNLIHNTLQLAKLRSPNITFEIEDLDLLEEVNDVIDSQGLILNDNNMDIENKIEKSIIVKADKLRLAEVFTNLISNAIKYKSEGKGKITISAIEHSLKRNVVISITDNGIGMTKDQLRKIFDEFYKANRFSNERTSSGLGLAICKRIVENLGGRIWVESPGPGKGSTFNFTLKLGDKKKYEQQE